MIQPQPGDDENDLVNAVIMQDAGNVLQAAEDFDAVDALDAASRLVVDGAQDFQPPLGMAFDPPDEFGGPSSRSDDQDQPVIVAPFSDRVHNGVDEDLLGPKECQAQAREGQEEQPADEPDFQ